jgi:voltage-dependent potassium channel beta subunit
MQKTTKMIYRYLGNSGLKVSALSWGNWVNTKGGNITTETVKVAYENGINFFDTAEIYGFGDGETELGVALKSLNARREDLVISTKVYRSGYGENDSFLSRKHIIEGINNSLKRLQLDYVDVYFCHRFDLYTPLEETVRAMNWVIEQGKAFYWGTSEWQPEQIMEAHAICERLGLIKPIVEQCQYSMLSRTRMESDYIHLFKKHKIGTTVWSPLFSGVLTGKYISGIPEGSRFDISSAQAGRHLALYNQNKESWDKKILLLKELATKLGCSLPQLALAWVIKNPDVSTCIVGASKTEQMVENIKCLEFISKITNEVEVEISEILENAPPGEMDWLTFTPLPNRRNTLFGIEQKK